VRALQQIEVARSAVRDVADRVLLQLGASDYERSSVLDVLFAADLRGQHSNGVQRLPAIAGRVRAGLIVPGALSSFVENGPSLVTLDGNFGFGPVTAIDACHRASELARCTGVGVVLVRHSNQFGMLAYYLERLARAGNAAILMGTSEAVARPAGGVGRVLGANRIGVAFPADPPFVLDMSTTATSVGRLIHAQQQGETIPPSWAVDELGRPTIDPDEALRGALNPFGGVKGYGLSLAITLLAGALTGTATGRQVRGVLDARMVSTKGELFVVVDPRRLAWGDEVGAQATAFLAEVRRSPPVDPTRPVLVPGDRGRARASFAASEDRMRLNASLWAQLKQLAAGRSD
jgi:LDH2 family malate/lactate/ureidoglycolate dehydrogenase